MYYSMIKIVSTSVCVVCNPAQVTSRAVALVCPLPQPTDDTSLLCSSGGGQSVNGESDVDSHSDCQLLVI